MWAHAEYVKLLRSTADGKVFDLIPEVATRYQGKGARERLKGKRFEVWKPIRKVRRMREGEILRIQTDDPFIVQWSIDQGVTTHQHASHRNSLDIEVFDLEGIDAQIGVSIQFTFYWTNKKQWEGQDYVVTVCAEE